MSASLYKVGDRVVVKSLEWYNENKDAVGCVRIPCTFVPEMTKWCGKVMIIRDVFTNYYTTEDASGWCLSFLWSDEMFEGLEVFDGEAYARTKNVGDLPKSIIHCAQYLGVESCVDISPAGYRDKWIKAIQELIICRDAYWKLADNWTPDHKDIKKKKHCIVTRRDKVSVATTTGTSRLLEFPTSEMAEAFYKNFKGHIDFCKEFI